MKYILLGLFASTLSFFTFLHESHEDKATFSPPIVACDNLSGLEKVICLADAFKATLNSTQLSALQLAYSKANAVKWSNLPQALTQTKRVGLQTSSLSATQWAALKALLKAAMGSGENEGYEEMNAILAADDYLLANGGGSTYGSGNYFIAFLGTPSKTDLWELQFGGHHFAFANTYRNGILIGATPAFRSSEPSGTFTQAGVTYQPMLQEKAAFAAVLAALSTSELAAAKSTSSFSDLILGPGKDDQFPTTKLGLKVGTLTQAKKDLVVAALNTYVADIDEVNATAILAKYKTEIDDTYLLYSGSGTMATKNDYIRIDGPSVWLEYSTQGGIVIKAENHPHSVWRDRSGDYGGKAATGIYNLPIFEGNVVLSPNPASNVANLAFELASEAQVGVKITDVMGRNVGNIKPQSFNAGLNNLELPIQQLPSGNYQCILEVTTSKGVFYTIKKLSKL
jgi:hypothetical protein